MTGPKPFDIESFRITEADIRRMEQAEEEEGLRLLAQDRTRARKDQRWPTVKIPITSRPSETPRYHSENWNIPPITRTTVNRRARYACESCGQRGQLELHHLRRFFSNDQGDRFPINGYELPEDLAAFCHTCHFADHRDCRGAYWWDVEEKRRYWLSLDGKTQQQYWLRQDAETRSGR